MRIFTLILCAIVLITTGLPLALKKLEDIGSDHFPLLIALNYEPDDDNTEGLEKTDTEEEAEVKEKIEDVDKE